MRRTGRFLRQSQILMLDDVVSHSAIDLFRRYRLSHGLLMPDALIAATALRHDIALITQNQRNFRFIPGMQLLTYPMPFAAS